MSLSAFFRLRVAPLRPGLDMFRRPTSRTAVSRAFGPLWFFWYFRAFFFPGIWNRRWYLFERNRLNGQLEGPEREVFAPSICSFVRLDLFSRWHLGSEAVSLKTKSRLWSVGRTRSRSNRSVFPPETTLEYGFLVLTHLARIFFFQVASRSGRNTRRERIPLGGTYLWEVVTRHRRPKGQT